MSNKNKLSLNDLDNYINTFSLKSLDDSDEDDIFTPKNDKKTQIKPNVSVNTTTYSKNTQKNEEILDADDTIGNKVNIRFIGDGTRAVIKPTTDNKNKHIIKIQAKTEDKIRTEPAKKIISTDNSISSVQDKSNIFAEDQCNTLQQNRNVKPPSEKVRNPFDNNEEDNVKHSKTVNNIDDPFKDVDKTTLIDKPLKKELNVRKSPFDDSNKSPNIHQKFNKEIIEHKEVTKNITPLTIHKEEELIECVPSPMSNVNLNEYDDVNNSGNTCKNLVALESYLLQKPPKQENVVKNIYNNFNKVLNKRVDIYSNDTFEDEINKVAELDYTEEIPLQNNSVNNNKDILNTDREVNNDMVDKQPISSSNEKQNKVIVDKYHPSYQQGLFHHNNLLILFNNSNIINRIPIRNINEITNSIDSIFDKYYFPITYSESI